MRSVLAKRQVERIDGVRLRGHREISRIEGLSDAVFGFAITLLIVSLQVPQTFEELLTAMGAFFPFAISFALMAQVWYSQFMFFRRYGLQDNQTVVLNVALLFVVLFYTYPLKFLFAAVFQSGKGIEAIRTSQFWQLWVIYGGGYAAIHLLFALMYVHALRRADAWNLTLWSSSQLVNRSPSTPGWSRSHLQ